ncbi:SDR family NAD(P)-dependent oxidoreductase [Hymenobacter sp. ASUV-10]|uniref:SDR family NAD(P)-dependent oxidoreductase n=1 Tax=Hymenobacter aranciens TaxID=3063996 RepID=A0ABT9BE38_9BACT|nr:SDR family NAD(P)-dependent oxidoreductase [Hymenobacter sp. ASUV-10]MDO7876040.1 SDR family NAD(P)-dependent oxidoreductase [Hymenobacter sp. ASUV-10]
MHSKRIALVTGANQGIGLQLAKELVANGYTVLVGARDLTKGEAAAASIGSEARALQLDVTVPGSIIAAAARIRSEFGRLDLLVNNAAISHAGAPGRSLAEIMQSTRPSVASLDEVRAVYETNVFGVIAVTQALLPLLREAPAARIVNVSSGLGSLTLVSDPTFPFRSGFDVVYSASKTALNAVTVAFALELESAGIKVNAVSPGFTATALNNFEGTDTLEEGSRAPVWMALDETGPTVTFVGPDGPMPW